MVDPCAADIATLKQAWGAERFASLMRHMVQQTRLAIEGGAGEINVVVRMHGTGVRSAKCNGHEVLTKTGERPHNPTT